MQRAVTHPTAVTRRRRATGRAELLLDILRVVCRLVLELDSDRHVWIAELGFF